MLASDSELSKATTLLDISPKLSKTLKHFKRSLEIRKAVKIGP